MRLSNASRHGPYELRFCSLLDPARCYSFPCDHAGVVDLDALSERGRLSYFFARALVGREVSCPRVHVQPLH